MKFRLLISKHQVLPALAFGILGFASCASSSPEFPLEISAPYAQQVPSAAWLDLARAAEVRLNYAEAGMWLDRYAALPDAELNEDFWFRRAALAEKGGDPFRSAEVRATLLQTRPNDLWLRIDLADDYQQTGRDSEALAVLDVTFADAQEQAYAWAAMVNLLLQGERKLEAALRCEQLGNLTAGSASKEWWQRASSLHEQLGDLTRATICIERALDGAVLRKEEERVVQRLHAFELGQPENVADALMLLRHHTDPDMRLAGLRYLSRDRFPKDIGSFEFALHDPDTRVVRLALQQLGLRAPPGRSGAILPFLQHENPEVVLDALHALGAVGTAAEVPIILEAMDPADRSQFGAARAACERITNHSLGLGLDPDLGERKSPKLAWWAWWQKQSDAGKLGG